MQKIQFKNSRNQNLAGVLHPGPFPTPIIMLHGYAKTKENNGYSDTVSKIINRAGFPIFQFDFAGCGKSDFQKISHQSEIEDLNSAIDFLQTQGFKKFGIIGHSMGGVIAVKSCLDETFKDKIKGIVLWASPTQPMNQIWTKWYRLDKVEQLKSEGKLTIPTPNNNFQKEFTISSDLIEESININQKELLENLEFPILLVHGDKDKIVPLQQSVDAIQFLSEESKLVTLKGADHNCSTHLEEISELAITFFNTYLKK